MNSFLKESWFKVGILLVLIGCLILLFLYEVNQQKMQKQEQIAGFNQSCQRLAMQNEQKLNQDDSLIIDLYQYKYNSTYGACILAYRGAYVSGVLLDALGRYLFEVDNLSTGEVIMSKRSGPGNYYVLANDDFQKLQMQYIGSTTPIQ
jgi:hypothetical protein